MAYFGDGSRLGVLIDYSLEEVPLNTIGPITLIDDLPENFLVMNGDILCNLDYDAFYMSHCSSPSIVSVSSFWRSSKIDFGVLQSNDHNRLVSFTEKPVQNYQVSMGIYCLRRSVIESLPKGVPYGFDQLMYDAIDNDREVRIVPFSGFWLDIGRPDDYQYADQNFEELAKKLNISIL
jgi:NDP-sugar pyrophosphorylase family protein